MIGLLWFPVVAVAEQNDRVTEEIVVRSARPVAIDEVGVVLSEEAGLSPATIERGLAVRPNVSAAGQGGRLQTFALRGFRASRLRVQLDGAVLRGLRRAGVAAELADPTWTRSTVTHALQGSRHGLATGAGTVLLETRLPREIDLRAGYESNGERFQIAAAGALGSARRRLPLQYAIRYGRGDRSQSGSGERLNDGFAERALTLRQPWLLGEGAQRTTLHAFSGLDWGKSAVDFPGRRTRYPQLRHLLLTHQGEWSTGIALSAWAHRQSLRTEVVEETVLRETAAQSLDYGVRVRKDWRLRRWEGAVGVAHLARDNYRVIEREGVLPGGTLRGGLHHESAIFANLARAFGPWSPELGIRLTRNDASANGASAPERWLWAGDLGLRWAPAATFEGYLRVGSSWTVPTLNQLFFTGLTGRGEVLANPELKPEQVVGFDSGLRWQPGPVSLSLSMYRLGIDDAIDRFGAADDLEQFRNAGDRMLSGGHVQLSWVPRAGSRFGLLAQWQRDPDRARTALPDVPPVFAELRWRQRIGVHWYVDLQARFAGRSRSTLGNRSIAGWETFDALIGYRSGAWSMSLYGRNLADRSYAATTDPKAAMATGRSFGLEIRRRGD
ncbi:MAG: TonB-dependent receptor [Pseudomonadota bacterium]